MRAETGYTRYADKRVFLTIAPKPAFVEANFEGSSSDGTTVSEPALTFPSFLRKRTIVIKKPILKPVIKPVVKP